MARKAATDPNVATIHDQTLVRGEGGELHQIANGKTDILATAQGGPIDWRWTSGDRRPNPKETNSRCPTT